MLKNYALAFCLVFGFLPSLRAQKPYFQQEVNTKIRVALDDQNHTLAGDIEIEYINNSPDALPEIWLHCWANAHQRRNTALDKQMLRTRSAKLHFADKDQRGGFSELDFSVDGQRVTWNFDPKNPDIAVLHLAQPVPPGGKIRIATPLKLKIPASFSRLGHVGQSYQMTQWFPKPAVYDNRGWHAMPYLNMGEFYSEFGNYDVSITLPENYVVGATGSLQTPSEVEFLAKKEAESRQILKGTVDTKDKSFPPSSANFKTIRFTAERVHDFAWFADKRFLVLKDTARLASGRTVDCWAMFGNEGADVWRRGAFFVRRSVEYYSRRVGEYPWPQATAVLSALSAGGGMEYPMITVINDEDSEKSLDEVITHEVGHNWFYGLLASNERDHPWMDEGMNSYYERAYMTEYYQSDVTDDMVPKWLIDPKKHGSLVEVGMLILARNGLDTPPDSHSDDFTMTSYGLQVYMKTAFCMRWLVAFLGPQKFDMAMQDYFRKWAFRHPYPEDFEAVMRENGVDIGWFMQQVQTRKHTDYRLKKAEKLPTGEHLLTIQNRGKVAAPFVAFARKGGNWGLQRWYPGVAGTSKVLFPATTFEPDAFLLDEHHLTLDVNRKNDFRRVGGLWRGRPLQVKMFAPIETPHKATLGILPWAGWNNYDKTQLGLVFYNPPLPGRRLQFYLAPGFGTGSGKFTGLGDVRWRIFPEHGLRGVTVGLTGKTFHKDYFYQKKELPRAWRVVPSVRLDLRSRNISFKHALQARAIFANTNEFDPKLPQDGLAPVPAKANIFELSYQGSNTALPNPYLFSIALERQAYEAPPIGTDENYLRLQSSWKQQFFYNTHRAIHVRAFAGFFLKNTARTRSEVGFGGPTDD
ncbi:MAG: M1 family metallopeptidase, partial [Saprospiraceae bacterium]